MNTNPAVPESVAPLLGVVRLPGAPGLATSRRADYCVGNDRRRAVLLSAMAGVDRVQERRRAAALARHYRDQEGLPIAEIARRFGRTPATVKAYLSDPSYANKRPTHSLTH